jgi:hypothetical protein
MQEGKAAAMSSQHLRHLVAAANHDNAGHLLLAQWRCDAVGFKDLVDHLLALGLLDRTATDLGADGSVPPSLLAELRAIASGHVVPVPGQDGAAYVQVFAMPLRGFWDQLLALQADREALARIAACFTASGLVSEATTVRLATELVAPAAAALTSPGHLRRLAVAAAEAELEACHGGSADDFTRLVRALSSDQGRSPQEEIGATA